ncbi:hypothetical protein [Methanococcoides seepicolus]|uniref:Uncharacterized protein n=1 Tax=Methanococcoides seepicolus TaxID=2828780 RepID=A0A9E4ZG47_9EURY|nr:hypothetical protein [Methanococcoides seepicolus]MCM1986284.1 hypothetical protein [Methanococcoides seepicolus]
MDDIFGEVVYTCTSEQAVEDGILFDILQVNTKWEIGIFRYITTNLMAQGYLQDDGINIPNLLDLLNQANTIGRHLMGSRISLNRFIQVILNCPVGRNSRYSYH